jgi:hypothetical protein
MGRTKMAATVGINVAGSVAYITLVEHGQVLDSAPYSVAPGDMLGSTAGLVKFEEDIVRQLGVWGAVRLVVLEPESTYSGSYKNFVDRIGTETLFLTSAYRAGVASYRLSRQKVRSILNLGREGTFEVLAAGRVTPVGPYWRKKRDCAALAALAGESE